MSGGGTAPVRATVEENGALLRIALARPKGNVLDFAMIEAIRKALVEGTGATAVKAVLFDAGGDHFSFGASVEEHRPGSVEKLLPAFHGLFRELAECGRVLIAAVRGQCLGGGLELAAFCHRVIAAPSARLACPEIRLGVFAPVASLVLPVRASQRHADDLLLTGRAIGASEALAIGLVDEIADDPAAAAIDYFRAHFEDLSASSLAFAVRAARSEFHREFAERLTELERIYLDGLMATPDAREGIDAFLEKREPRWRQQR
jgi:cyclohexa-1,5-dienecarbonyl-CoA hydratase